MFAAGIAAAAPASADPADLVPYCTGASTPMDTNCRAAPSENVTLPESGLSPDLPFGLNPGSVPVV